MEYKKIIKSQKLRLKILSFLDFIPDKQMIQLQYRIKTGRKLNLKNSQRYTEKLQWYKLYYRNPLMLQCADKYAVREYVESKGLGYVLNDLYGVYDSVEEINFDDFPSQFVIKTTNGGGGNNIILCKNKDLLNKDIEKQKIKEWLKPKTNKFGREWVYDFKPRIIVEKLLPRDQNNDLPDYKFICFNGKPQYLYVMIDRFSESGMKLGIFDIDFNKLPYQCKGIPKIDREIEKPNNFDVMIEMAKILSKDFPHVRVDFYNINGEIVFGELTFFDGSGYDIFTPDEADFILGEGFNLPKENINE